MTTWALRGLLIATVAVTIAIVLPGIRELVAVDRCLDAGGVYDYSRRTCRTDVQTLPAHDISLFQSPDRGSIIVALAVAVAMARLFMSLDRRRRRPASTT